MRPKHVMIGMVTLNVLGGVVLAYLHLPIHWIFMLPGVNIIGVCWMYQMQRKWLSVISSNTDMEKEMGISAGIDDYLKRMTAFSKQVRSVFHNIGRIGEPEFIRIIQTVQDDEVRESLLTANENIIALREKERASNWVAQGVASISEINDNGNMGQYALQVVTTIVKYIDANQGGFFLTVEEDGHTALELIASYAYGKRRHVDKKIQAGEGILGQVLYEKEMIFLTEVPKDYIKITSGLGEALPRCVCIVPFIHDDQIYGAVELASFNILRPFEMEFLQKISVTVGYNLAAIRTHLKTERLLHESQKMTQEVKSQEEELRQNMEELTATQEDMRRRQAEMDSILSSLSTVELDMDGLIISANDVFLGVTGYKQPDVVGKAYKSLIPQNGNDLVQYDIMWNSIQTGRTFSGEFRVRSKDRKEIWIAGNFTPLMDNMGQPYKVMVISLFTTQDKEKLLEMQQLIAAFKSTFPMAEINADLTFKSANDLFLSELGIKRLELKKCSPRSVFTENSLKELTSSIQTSSDQIPRMLLDLQERNGIHKTFDTALVKITRNGSGEKKGLLIVKHVQ